MHIYIYMHTYIYIDINTYTHASVSVLPFRCLCLCLAAVFLCLAVTPCIIPNSPSAWLSTKLPGSHWLIARFGVMACLTFMRCFLICLASFCAIACLSCCTVSFAID